MAATKIVIDATSRMFFSSFYVQGLYDRFGKKNVSFGRKPFKDLVRQEKLFSFNHFFAFVAINGKKMTRYVIDYCDPPDISAEAYSWCDVYAKINFDQALAEEHPKLIVIPPGFGLQLWSLPETMFHVAKNLVLGWSALPVGKIVFLRDYWQTYRRVALDWFLRRDKNNERSYVFLTATLWTSDENADRTNLLRKKFIETCRQMDGVDFEGGLFALPEHPEYEAFAEVAIPHQYSVAEFIRKNKASAVSFNTPAVHNCHGWKIAEYLAMGKAIISTPLSYDFPEPLVHGQHIHFIRNEHEMAEAIQHILKDKTYRERLEQQAQAYFNSHMAPAKVVQAVLAKGGTV